MSLYPQVNAPRHRSLALSAEYSVVQSIADSTTPQESVGGEGAVGKRRGTLWKVVETLATLILALFRGCGCGLTRPYESLTRRGFATRGAPSRFHSREASWSPSDSISTNATSPPARWTTRARCSPSTAGRAEGVPGGDARDDVPRDAVRATSRCERRRDHRATAAGRARAVAQAGVGIAVGLATIGLVDAYALRGALSRNAPLVAAVSTIILAVGILASLGPARRGLRIQPAEVLKQE